MSRQNLRDPMLHAASEGMTSSSDYLRWMQYADDELHRLRQAAGLPTPTGYAAGEPNYGPIPDEDRTPSEVLAVERIHTWIAADPEDRRVVIDSPDERDIRVRFMDTVGEVSEDTDAMLANAVLCAELIVDEEADDAR